MAMLSPDGRDQLAAGSDGPLFEEPVAAKPAATSRRIAADRDGKSG